RYPSSCGVRTNGVVAHPGQPLLPELISEAGYHTAAFGKIHYHPVRSEPDGYWPENVHCIDSGMDLTQPYLGFETIRLGCGHGDVIPGLHARELERDHPEIYRKRGPKGALEVPDPALHQGSKLETYKTAIPEEHYATSWVVDRTVEYLEKAEEPFFVWCGINDPHHPFKPPGEYWHRFRPADMPLPSKVEGELDHAPPHFRGFQDGVYSDLKMDGYYLGDNPYLTDDAIRIIRAAYYGMVSMIDDGMTRILGALQSRGLDERTLVFFLTDHGELLGDHGLILKGPFHYQSSLRVPLLARGPGLPSGHVVNGPVGLIDLFPTLLELAGASAPDGIQSESLVPQLTGTSSAGRDGVLIEQDVDVMDIRLRSMISDRWRITHYASQPYGELYDLESDPNEFENLWDRGDPKVKNELLAQLLDLMATNDDWLPPKVCHA
ncbi:MAG: sulfatase-like hydrolase/transferase, partial [Candidatus Latescibacteria bacterium]|nr:sulfatase-like hydrolase/transferase [Candidatus Latescibacterota bacterium]